MPCSRVISILIFVISTSAFCAFFLLSETILTPAATAPLIPIAIPTGPASARSACPPTTPAPPTVNAPPPSHASAAFAAAAPLRELIAAPVDAVPNVVAAANATLGPSSATPAPAAVLLPNIIPDLFRGDLYLYFLSCFSNF